MMTAGQWQPKVGGKPGELVMGLDELEQSLRTVLTTQVGSVPGRPGFGSRLFELVDEPTNQVQPKAIREVLRAVAANEPRVVVTKVAVLPSEPGNLVLEVTWRPTNSDVSRPTTIAPRAT